MSGPQHGTDRCRDNRRDAANRNIHQPGHHVGQQVPMASRGVVRPLGSEHFFWFGQGGSFPSLICSLRHYIAYQCSVCVFIERLLTGFITLCVSRCI
jgi:hypothetical protein